MRKIGLLVTLGGLLPFLLEAQNQTQSYLPPPTSTNAQPPLTAATIASRSANERVWVRINYTTNADGSILTNTSRAYHEIATGIGKLAADGTWVDADPTINIVANGAQATGTRHSVAFAADALAGAADGWAIHLTDYNGSNFSSSVYALRFSMRPMAAMSCSELRNPLRVTWLAPTRSYIQIFFPAVFWTPT